MRARLDDRRRLAGCSARTASRDRRSRDILKRAVEATPGAIGGAFADSDGEMVDCFATSIRTTGRSSPRTTASCSANLAGRVRHLALRRRPSTSSRARASSTSSSTRSPTATTRCSRSSAGRAARTARRACARRRRRARARRCRDRAPRSRLRDRGRARRARPRRAQPGADARAVRRLRSVQPGVERARELRRRSPRAWASSVTAGQLARVGRPRRRGHPGPRLPAAARRPGAGSPRSSTPAATS